MFEAYFIPCPIKARLGIDCPGCGMQRSISALLNGNLVHSIKLYPASIPILLFILMCGVLLLFRVKNSSTIIRTYAYVILIIIGINYLYKVFSGTIYS
jgi:hypothetical protein